MNVFVLLPSPTHGVWHIGPLPIRAYALTMIAAMAVACLIAARRLGEAGHKSDAMWDIALWAIPFGIVGARLYHVLSSPDAYFGPGGDPWRAFAIWEGGLGVWGAVALGAVGGVIGARRAGLPVGVVADAVAPALAVAQAVGRLGNWFNQELFGAPTTLPWGLQVSPAVAGAAGYPADTLFHPTFLYELLWDLGVAFVLVKACPRWRWGHGQVFFAYMTLYCLGRVWIEALRIDTVEHVLGLRLNVWTSILVGLAGVALFVFSRRKWGPAAPAPVAAGDGAEDDVPADAPVAAEDDVESAAEDGSAEAGAAGAAGAAEHEAPTDAAAAAGANESATSES
ncbi:MAG: prolipoprotein diacylglyceryl transferase [Bifidobacteriaceae bacterium]|jgi:prolipoprotein diacylglyceryl transferase|nr:prolipoprotein diacylglyceryl transferase [Bifidobacteriaceae bacterium]